MANWVSNKLIIKGEQSEIERLIQSVRTKKNERSGRGYTGKELVIDFEKIVPRPDLYDMEELREEAGELLDSGFPDWYAWNCFKWGTKWNADAEENKWKISKGSAYLLFMTAWTPPVPIITELGLQYPKLDLTLYFSDPLMDFAGEVIWENGEFIVEDHYSCRDDAAKEILKELEIDLSEFEEEEDEDEEE